MNDWVEVSLHVVDEHAEDVAARLIRELGDAAGGVELRAGEIVFWASAEEAEAVRARTQAHAATLASQGVAIDPNLVSVRPAMPEEQWRDAWKRYFKVIRLTRQIVVVPSWETYTPLADDHIIHLDPGQAFGTGAHASTRLVLNALQQLHDEGVLPKRILDLGTGSGILAIAAARFWPTAEIWAVDNDPLAVQVAVENATINHVTVTPSSAPLSDAFGVFDIVLANIQANVLLDLRDGILARLAPAGHLVLSGLLTPQAAEVGQAYTQSTVCAARIQQIVASSDDGEWSSVRLIR